MRQLHHGLIIIFSFLLVACQTAPDITGPITAEQSQQLLPRAQANKQYLNFLKQVQAKEMSTDFTKLRELYIKTDYYAPFSLGHSKLLSKAYQEGDYTVCVELVKLHLRQHEVSLLGHYTGMVCHAKIDDEGTYLYHQYMLDGLIESIAASGRGIAKDSPIMVVSKEEMNLYVDLQGLKLIDQKVIREEGKVLNQATIQGHPEHPHFTLYFDLQHIERYHNQQRLQQQQSATKAAAVGR